MTVGIDTMTSLGIAFPSCRRDLCAYALDGVSHSPDQTRLSGLVAATVMARRTPFPKFLNEWEMPRFGLIEGSLRLVCNPHFPS